MELAKHWAGELDDYVIDLDWSPDGSALAAASAGGPVLLFEAPSGATRAALLGHDGGTNALAWSPDSAVLASGGQDGAVKLWEGASGRALATQDLGSGWVEHLGWRPAPAAPLLAAAAGRKLLLLAADGSLERTFPDAPKTVTALAWQPDGDSLAAAYFGGVCLWGADDGVSRKELAYGNGIHALAWSPDGRWLVSGNQDPSVRLWVPADGTELQMSGYEGKVRHLSFDRSSRWLATSGSSDACVWDCSGAGPEGREPLMLPHEAPVCAVAFQHEHSLLATAASDGTVRIWSPERPKPLRATVRVGSAPTKVSWSGDDSLLAIGLENGSVFVLRSQP